MADSSETSRVKVSIVGAGIAGPVLALSILSNPDLRRLYEPILYDKLAPPGDASTASSAERGRSSYAAGAAVALTSNALFPLYQLGLKEALHRVSSETAVINIWRVWNDKTNGTTEELCPHKWLNRIKNPNWNRDFGTNLRVVERKDLQAILLEKIQGLGGLILWNKKLKEIKKLDKGLKLEFEDGSTEVTGLLVGADGSWSSVRRWIIEQQGSKPAETWKPNFSSCGGIYGIAERFGDLEQETKPGDTHWIMLNEGMASTWSLPNGKLFWTVSLPENKPPGRSSANEPQNQAQLYEADLSCGGYSFESTMEILAGLENVWHPVGSFGEIFKHSDRIVRVPLWHKAWEVDEIGSENAVVIGDASRALLPTSGQGACFGIEDATVLANALLNHCSVQNMATHHIKSAIYDYASSRVPRSKKMDNQSYWTTIVGLAQSWWWRWLRDFGTAWVPLGGDPKIGPPRKDPMGWLHDARYEVRLALTDKESSTT